MTSQSFRSYLFPSNDPRINSLVGVSAADYLEVAKNDSFAGPMIDGWAKLYPKPFVGITSDGSLVDGLYSLKELDPEHAAPTRRMVYAALGLLAELGDGQRESLRYPLDAHEWRSWANPEFRQFNTGVRLEELSAIGRAEVFDLVAASLSPEGFQLVRDLMRINAFLGDEVGLPALMNEFSYQFALYGDPSLTEPWGWQLYGHHVALNVVVVGSQLVVSPVFLGAEPNMIDRGPYAGTQVFDDRIAPARQLMQLLPPELRERAIVYRQMVDPQMPEGRLHPGDERHLGGCFQDNRVIPYEGVKVAELGEAARDLLLTLIRRFISILPDGAARARIEEIRDHLDDTWFSWIGGWGPDDAFYYRIQSPVVILELDHHTGVFLSNTEPAPFHIHTVIRTPNGNDYGRELVRQKLGTNLTT